MDISLSGGKLVIPGLSEDNMRVIYNRFRKDLLDANIIHFRPVAFVIDGALGNNTVDNINKIPSLGYSFSELSFILNNIIVSGKHGVMPTSLNSVASLSKLRSDCSYITLNGTTIGTSIPGSMFYCGEGMTSMPKTLIKDMTIFKKLKQCVSITVILMRGSGTLDFKDNQRLISNTSYKPMRTYYSLCEFFKLRAYTGGDHFQLHYVKGLDEDVLREILQDYFNTEEVEGCLR